jgi:hypothetical protein
MAKYELDLTDQEAGDYVAALRWVAESEGMPLSTKSKIEVLCGLIDNQIPVTAPTKIGALVRTESEAFLRADGSSTPWIRVRLPGVAFVERPDWLADDQIGRITEVLSEGVDL